MKNRRHFISEDHSGIFVVIPLTQRYATMVDIEDYPKVKNRNWYFNNGYAMTNIKGKAKAKAMYLHRVIMNPPDGFQVDHKNHNTLDNRRYNLRVCTPQQNQFNKKPSRNSTSRFKGVNLHQGKWLSRIKLNGKDIYLGFFKDEVAAAIAYNQAARELYGEFARLNDLTSLN